MAAQNMWYFSVNTECIGPITEKDKIDNFVRENPGAWCWKQGMPDWQLVYKVPDVRRMKKDGFTPFPPPKDNFLAPKPASLPKRNARDLSHKKTTTKTPTKKAAHPSDDTPKSEGFGSSQYTDGIDFKIYGKETQFVEVELDPGESAIAEAGAMMYKMPSIEMETIFGDGRKNEGGFFGRLVSAGSRLLTSESLFTTVFTQEDCSTSKGRVAFAAPYPGTITAIKLSDVDGKLICQKDSFLAGAKGVQVGIEFQRRILTGLFGGEGFIMQKLEGSGWVFVHMGGTIRKLTLRTGQSLQVDTGCLAAMTSNIQYDVKQAGGIKTMLFGGEGLFFAELKGPHTGEGTVWLQSLPFSRLAGRMLAAAPSHQSQGTSAQGEGSLLGVVGDMFNGR